MVGIKNIILKKKGPKIKLFSKRLNLKSKQHIFIKFKIYLNLF